MCSVYIVLEEYNYILSIEDQSSADHASKKSGKQNVAACSHTNTHATIWTRTLSFFKSGKDYTPAITENHSTKVLYYCLILMVSFCLIATAMLPTICGCTKLSNMLKEALNYGRTNKEEDYNEIFNEIKRVHEDLFCLFNPNRPNYESMPNMAKDPLILINSIKNLVTDAIKVMEWQNDQKVSDLKSAQKMFESEVQKDFRFMLAVKDSTIFALRMSMKENDLEIKRLRNTIKLQHQSFLQSSEVVKALKNGLLLQHKMKEQFGMNHSARGASNLAASIRALENYYSQYDSGRQNSIYWSYPEGEFSLCSTGSSTSNAFKKVEEGSK